MLTRVVLAGFIRGLLENVGAEIDPIRLIRRIKNGLEIPGLKLALIKILQDFNLQVRARSLARPSSVCTTVTETRVHRSRSWKDARQFCTVTVVNLHCRCTTDRRTASCGRVSSPWASLAE